MFNQVQFRAIRGQEINVQTALCPTLELVFKLFRSVRRRIVDDYPRLFINQPREGIETVNYNRGINRALNTNG